MIQFGDCIELIKNIPTGSVDMICADLPYGTTRNKWDSIIDMKRLGPEYRRVIKPNGNIVLFGSGMFTAYIMNELSDIWRYNLIWEKGNATGHLNASRMPLRAHEDIMVFYKETGVYNPQKTTGHIRKISTAAHRKNTKLSTNYGSYKPNGYDSTERFPRSVLKFKSDKQKSKLHPTQKPVSLVSYLVSTYSNPGDTVLDNCAGSGTTVISCIKTARKCLAFENDPNMYEKAIQRINIELQPNQILI
jgi:site-specific DNA-methyltransferase (adenine-specific)